MKLPYNLYNSFDEFLMQLHVSINHFITYYVFWVRLHKNNIDFKINGIHQLTATGIDA